VVKSRRSVLRERDVALLAGAIGISTLGDWLANIALLLAIKEMTDSGIAVALLLICLWAPSVVLAGHVGLLVDRFETTRLLVFLGVAQAAVATALALVETASALLVLTAFLGVGFAVSQAAEFALVPAVADASRVQEVNGHVETARYLGFGAGPLLGGFLTSVGGMEIAMLVNAGTFLVVAAAALALRARRPAARLEAGEPRPRARDGVVLLFGDRLLALAMTVAFVSLLFMSASIPADVFFAQDVLGVGDVAFALVYTAWTIGMIFGALFVAQRIPARALVAAAFVAVAVQGLGKAVPPIFLLYGVMLAGYLVGGVGHGVKNVAFRTMIHQRVPAAAHGRAFAAYNGLRNGAELAALAAGGILVTTVGARGTLWLAGGVSALAGIAGLVALRRVPRREPEPASAASTIGSP
jgi:predicted MFS family arabinose efflux permease